MSDCAKVIQRCKKEVKILKCFSHSKCAVTNLDKVQFRKMVEHCFIKSAF